MASRHLPPLKPKPGAPSGDDHDSDPQLRQRKSRTAVLVACDPCRRLKTKCDGERPACRRCYNKRQECTYEIPEDALSRSSARKELTSRLQHENSELRRLLYYLSKRPEPEAYDIFQRLRFVDDPITLAQSIMQAELLLLNTISETSDEFRTLQKLELDAFERSAIKVTARPWTAVAGDGIVSELISAWFKWDHAFLYGFIDRECFMRDIHAAEPESAKYCSPFLINAICALRSYFSDTVDTVRRITKQDMREQFLAETKKQYDHEIPVLPTIQGLWIMFAISYLKGEDRSGSLYRFASYGMLKRSRITHVFSSLTDTESESLEKKRAISKTLWGIFCLESITATNFRNADILQPPTIPCLFPEFDYENINNTDILGRTFTDSSPNPPSVIGAINAFCQVSVLMSEVLAHEQHCKDNEETGGQANHIKRSELLAKLSTIGDALPSALRHDYNFTPETCFLRIVMNTVACAILRPLRPDVVLDALDETTVKTAMLKNCTLGTELMEQYFARWPTGEFSTMAFIGPLNSGTVLLPLLPDEDAKQIFSRTCRLMRIIATRMPIAGYVMKGWKSALWSRKLEIPDAAQPYFENLGGWSEDLDDVPSKLVVTHIPHDEDPLSNEWDHGELGFLLQKWSAMSIE
ncbi:putative C6 transcription factor [Xylaria digitata]|nr:putative C6 transcription factor [Xylaria digitata]